MNGRTGLSVCAGLSVLICCAGQAAGQNALGDGRALDRNLRVGSGGVNTPVRDLQSQIRYNNAIVTGQAAGGRSFRGDLGYRADNEFGASLGSDANYTFRRDAAYSAAPLLGIRTSDAVRYQFALSTGSALPTQLAGTYGAVNRYSAVTTGSDVDARVRSVVPAPVDTARVSGTGPISDGTGGQLRSTSRFTTERAIRPTLVGFTNDDAGGEYTITASPLLGVNLFKSGQSERIPEPRPGETLPSLPGQRLEDLPAQPGQPNNRPVVSPLSGFEAGAGNSPSALEAFGTSNVPRIDNAIRGAALGPSSIDHQRVLSRFETAYLDNAEGVRGGQPSTAPGSDGRLPTGPDTDPGDATASNGASSPVGRNDSTLASLGWEQQLVRTRASLRGEDPVEALNRFERDRTASEQAESQPSGVSSLGPLTVNLDEDALRTELEAMARAGNKLGLTPETLRALRTAGVNFDRLDGGLLPSRGRRVDEESYKRSMAAGQDMLAAGRFFDAEERFARALSAAPADALASIGRVHAQVGGGLYLSAAANLRRLIIDHPELLASTFSEDLVPKPERVARIRGQLLDVLEAKRDRGNALGRDAGLLLAYLGHITGDVQTTQRGLGEFEQRLNEDEKADAALAELLSKVWLEPTAK